MIGFSKNIRTGTHAVNRMMGKATMKLKQTTSDPSRIRMSGKLHLQPLSVALVCIVFISLMLVMGLLNKQALEKTLDSYMEERGLSIVRNVQETALKYYQRLLYTPRSEFDAGTGFFSPEDTFDLQDALINEFIGLANELDLKYRPGDLNPKDVAPWPAKEGLWLLAFLDGRGDIDFMSRPVPDELLALSRPVALGAEEIKINFYSRDSTRNWVSFIVLQRKSTEGAVLLALDDRGFRYRSLKVAFQRSIDEVNQNHGISYFLVTDPNNKIIGLAGEPPVLEGKEKRINNIASGKAAVATRKLVFNGRNLFEISAPLYFNSEYSLRVKMSLMRDEAEKILEKNKINIFISMGLMMVIAFLSMWFLYKNQNRHLAKIQAMERQVLRAEKLSALGRLAAGVAHEIRNPLNAISMATQRLHRDNFDELTGIIRDEIRRLDHIIEDFLNLSGTRKLKLKRHDITDSLKQITILMEEETLSKGVTIKTRWHNTPVTVFVDPDKIKQVFLNIIKNAMESVARGGTITLSAAPRDNRRACVKISDTGTGLDAEEIEQIFDPDYSTKKHGLGMGLTIAHEIIRIHGGEIRVTSQKGQGTVFEILLPSGSL